MIDWSGVEEASEGSERLYGSVKMVAPQVNISISMHAYRLGFKLFGVNESALHV